MQSGYYLIEAADCLREGCAHVGHRGGPVETTEDPVSGLIDDDDLAIADRLEKQTVNTVKFVLENRHAAGQTTSGC